MNLRMFNPRNDYKIPKDILFQILIKFDIQDLLLLLVAIKRSEKSSENITEFDYQENKEKDIKSVFDVLEQPSFWKENAEYYFSQQQLFQLPDYKKFRIARYRSGDLIKCELDKFNFSNKTIVGKRTYRGISLAFFENFGATFEEINDLIVRDEADELFIKFIGTAEFLSEVKKYDYDKYWVREYLDTNILLDEHVHFNNLIKCMIELRAFKCFELFMRTSMILYSSLNDHNKLSSQYRADKVRKIVLESKDEYFNKRYISLAIKLLRYTVQPSESIQYAINCNYGDVLRESLNSLSETHRNALLEKCAASPLFIPKETLERYCSVKLGPAEKLNDIVKEAETIKIKDYHCPEMLNEIDELERMTMGLFGQWKQNVKDIYSSQYKKGSENQPTSESENKRYSLST